MSSLDPTRIRRQKLYDFLYSLFKIFNRDFFFLFCWIFLVEGALRPAHESRTVFCRFREKDGRGK